MSVTVVDKRATSRGSDGHRDSAGAEYAQRGQVKPRKQHETPPWFPVFVAFEQERMFQLEKWGVQRIADGTGHPFYRQHADEYRRQNDARTASGREPTWAKVLLEEVYEALAEDDPDKLEHELIQTGAVVTAWLEHLAERRGKAA